MDGLPPSVELLETGARLPGPGRRGAFVAYRDLIHVAATLRGLRLSTRGGVLGIPRVFLSDSASVLRVAQALRARVGELPDGAERLQGMEALDRIVSRAQPPRLTHALLGLCGLLFALQLLVPGFTEAGALHLELSSIEPWRMVTGHFLHEPFGEGLRALLSPHLLLNGLGLWALGSFVERILGPSRTAAVLLLAGVGTVWASSAAGYPVVIGASGLVMGLAGGMVVLEVVRPEQVPAPWRIHRGLLLGLVAGDLLLTGFLPGVAHAAHWGGLAGGALGAWAVTAGLVPGKPTGLGIQRVGFASGALVLLGLVGLGWSVLAPDMASLRRASRLIENPSASPGLLNDEAWMIAISEDVSEERLAVAERMAERAVDETSRTNPSLLDTLAEIAFLRGRRSEAVDLIDEAIRLAPRIGYFREQRRRFLGERAADDRPPGPMMPAPPRREPFPLPEEGLRV
ncbi:MAG: rhomboid family intramembrane serine protease [Deltaproteobacteria bacterium]|nr:rhomboid family intramembrane serine protease [Deltaproteobacteria bacterium]